MPLTLTSPSAYSLAAESAEVKALIEKYTPLLERAVLALQTRDFFAQWPEAPNAYPEADGPAGLQAFQHQLGKAFDRLKQPADAWLASDETSPYTGKPLGISYPTQDINSYIAHAQKAQSTWKKVSPAARAALLFESLERMKNNFHEIAHATQHGTGQAFMMSFQASGPHAADRALEAVALGWKAQQEAPASVVWEKPMGKRSAVMHKYFKSVPLGVSLAIGCSTFPVWNSVPGIYASLVTGNPVIVKPHPLGIYSLAIVVGLIQQTLADFGYDPLTIQLAADTQANPLSKHLAEHPAVKIIDFTGGSAFGSYIESLPGKVTFTEKAGVNSIIIDSVDDIKAVAGNISFSLSLYSGQMCTCPQNIYIPEGGVPSAEGQLSFDQVAEAIAAAVKGLVTNEKAGPAIGGAVQNAVTAQRVASAKGLGKVWLESHAIPNPEFPEARTASPLILEVSSAQKEVFSQELFGPIAFLIKTKNTAESLALAQELATTHGAISCSAYTTDEATLHQIADGMADAGTPVSFNLTGQVFVNQNAGFSDFHVTGANPAGNASFTDLAYVVKRFHFVGARINP